MKRYFDDKKFKRLCKDFKFMVEKIKNYKGELDLRLRDNYFNLYYKGNSLAKVTPRSKDYKIEIHKKFSKEIFKMDERFTIKEGTNKYCNIYAENKDLCRLFKKEYLDKLFSNIKEVNYSEEIAFEQMLVTDNSDRRDLIIIDRQVTETGMGGTLDLLGLKQRKEGKDNHFYFKVIEVKLGNSKDLACKVGEQLNRYINHIELHIANWICSYKETYRQMKILGLFKQCPWDEIEIDDGVEGIVVVGGYSGIAKESIDNLRKNYPELKIKFIKNKL